MHRYELRVYSLTSREDLDFFKDVIYPRHLSGFFPKAGIRAHGFWTVPDDQEHRLFVLASTNEVVVDAAEAVEEFRDDPDFLDDLRGFDPSRLLGVEVTHLTPTASSPLQ
jgi:hypothetical protein